MKRRTAIKNIILVSAGTTLFPSCDFEIFNIYENVPLEKHQYKLIRQLMNVILPQQEPMIQSMETPLDFLLTMLNDCYKKEDIQKYLAGLADFEQYISESLNSSFKKLKPEQQTEVLQFAFTNETASNEMQFFVETNKQLTIQHFTQSEYYLSKYLDFEFVPGRYIGCVAIN